MVIKLKRAYAVPESGDGCRVLVDRLWPRGVSQSAARIDLWLKEIALSAMLRKWFGHDPSKWTTFRDRYFRELDNNPKAVEQLMEHRFLLLLAPPKGLQATPSSVRCAPASRRLRPGGERTYIRGTS
jgi:uncharacterized protein YeaO (DUF488 family)